MLETVSHVVLQTIMVYKSLATCSANWLLHCKKIYKEITRREVLAVWLTIATKGFCFSEDIIVEGGCSVFQHCKMCVYVNATIAFSMYVFAAIILHDVCTCW